MDRNAARCFSNTTFGADHDKRANLKSSKGKPGRGTEDGVICKQLCIFLFSKKVHMKQVVFLLFFLATSALAQVRSVDELDQKYLNWQNKSLAESPIAGIGTDKAYQDILKNKQTAKTIIVAVIDSGVDIDHEDLKDKIWVNPNEIPTNNIDDDQNGFVDDVHGWNFIGNKNGENVFYENMEYARLYKEFKKKGNSAPIFLKAKLFYEKELEKRQSERDNILRFENNFQSALAIIKDQTGVEVKQLSDLQKVSSSEERVLAAKKFLEARMKQGIDLKMIHDYKKSNAEFIEKFLNLELNA
ncbi:MAG: hypothetical protein ACKO96_39900 [Flammeovirgaceae bacterium]